VPSSFSREVGEGGGPCEAWVGLNSPVASSWGISPDRPSPARIRALPSPASNRGRGHHCPNLIGTCSRSARPRWRRSPRNSGGARGGGRCRHSCRRGREPDSEAPGSTIQTALVRWSWPRDGSRSGRPATTRQRRPGSVAPWKARRGHGLPPSPTNFFWVVVSAATALREHEGRRRRSEARAPDPRPPGPRAVGAARDGLPCAPAALAPFAIARSDER